MVWASSFCLMKVLKKFSTAPSMSSLGAIERQSFRNLSMRTLDSWQSMQRQSLPGDFLKWASLGFCRGSKFATGFTPLQPKPLDTIIDIERVKNRSAEEIISIWDDPKPLDTIIDIEERVKNRSAEEIISIWDDYHLGRGHIGASMNAKLYKLLEHRAGSCRYFVIPLRRGSGYTTMFLQVQMPHLLFTGLEDYKARGTQVAPYFTVTYYPEFTASKDVVLIRGDIVFTSKLTDEEAKWLLETAQSFYLNDMRYKLVEQFNKSTHDFEFKDVLQALDMPVG